jgi:two-component system chemotaxis response regulator CheB
MLHDGRNLDGQPMAKIIVIAASAGGLVPVRQIIAALPVPCASFLFVVMHIGANRSVLPSLLSRPGFPAGFGQENEPIEPGRVYVAPPDRHMILEPGRIRLSHGPKINHTRPAADPLFESAAAAYGRRVIGIVLSGGDGDGAVGLRTIKAHGGTAFVQHPDDAPVPGMPQSAIVLDHPDACLPVSELARRVAAMCSTGARHSPAETPITDGAPFPS